MMTPKINKAAAIAALKAGGVLRTTRAGSQMWASLTTVDKQGYRVTTPTFNAILTALGDSLKVTHPSHGVSERRYVGGAA